MHSGLPSLGELGMLIELTHSGLGIVVLGC